MRYLQKIFVTLLLSVSLITSSVAPINQVTTVAQAATVKITKKTLSLNVGDKKTIKITGTTKKVTWSSDNKAVATVSSKGTITAKASGEAIITASVSSKTLTCKVTVVDAVSSATIKKK